MFGHFVETRRNLIHMPPGDYLTFPHLAPNKFSKTKKKKKKKEKKEELTWEQNILYLTRLQNWSRRTGGGRTEEEENKKKKQMEMRGSLHKRDIFGEMLLLYT